MKKLKKIAQQRVFANVIFATLALMSLIASVGIHHDNCDFISSYPQGELLMELITDVCAMVRKG